MFPFEEAFDEKLRDFLSDSGERLTDLKRHHDAKLHRRSAKNGFGWLFGFPC
ncbi:MAG: hypothetical protein KY445_17385 [Armatimonadetes bacterium]|nr:hypothetical protein [Armatimonadota bacterium]